MSETFLLLNVIRVKAHGGKKKLSRQDLSTVRDFLQQEAQKLVRALVASAPEAAKAELLEIPYSAHVAVLCQSGHHTKYKRCKIPGMKGNVYLSFDSIPLNFTDTGARIKIWSKYRLSPQQVQCMLSTASACAGKPLVVILPSYMDIHRESPDESSD